MRSLGTGFERNSRIFFFFFYLFKAAATAYEVPRIGFKWELSLQAYTRATATRDPSLVCDLQPRATATPEPQPNEQQGQGANPQPHGS